MESKAPDSANSLTLESKRTSPNLFSLTRRWRRRNSNSEPLEGQLISPTLQAPLLLPRLMSVAEVPDPLSEILIQSDYTDLYRSIVIHVSRFYTISNNNQKEDLRSNVARATAGFHLPARQIASLLSDNKTRPGAIALCISWTILSRCLLLKSGMSNSPSSTFLPPEIVESFQNFSLGQGLRGVSTNDQTEGNSKYNFFSNPCL